MKTKQQLIKEKEKIEKQLKEIDNKELYIEVPELGIKITKTQQFNGKKYKQILEEVKEEKIATHNLLIDLRNIAFDSNFKKYSFMKKFWVFVPNPDKVTKEEERVARFGAYSYCLNLGTYRDSVYSGSDLGVFLIEKLEKKK